MGYCKASGQLGLLAQQKARFCRYYRLGQLHWGLMSRGNLLSCCESCICSWSTLPSLNKRSHWPTWCHLFLLTLLHNCWFISLSSDFSICLDWWAKQAEPYMHTQSEEEENSRLARQGVTPGPVATALALTWPGSLTPQAAPVAPVQKGRKSRVVFISYSGCLAGKHVVWFHLYCFVIEVSFCIIQNERISFWLQFCFPTSALAQIVC